MVIVKRDSRARSTTIGGIAALGIGALLLAGCSSADDTAPVASRAAITLKLGALLPQTGSLAQFGPAAAAAVQLAVVDVNAADVGITLEVEYRDAGDASSDIGLTSANDLISLGVTAIIGPVSNGVAKKVIGAITSAGVLQVSPGNTSPDFTAFADDGLYWRTTPSCVLEGSALGDRIADDGVASLGVIDQRGFCNAGLGDVVAEAFERGGGEVVAQATLDESDGAIATKVADVVAAKPAAIAVVGTQVGTVVPLLASAGYKGDQLYLSGIPISDHSGDYPAGSLTGSIATLPGLDIGTLGAFTDRLLEIDPAIADFSFAAEAYDAVVLVALGALAAGGTSGKAIAGKLQEVSGGSGGGAKATDFASAAAIVLGGGVVDYDGYSGPISFDDKGDPAGAIIGLYQYGEDNKYRRLN